jgi:hypothetical protein
MAMLQETSVWENGVYQLEVEDGPEGGAEGIDNVPPRQLANRTIFLNDARLAGSVEGKGRNLMTVLGAASLTGAMDEIGRRCNNNGEIDASGVPDFDGLMPGDYLDGIDLSAIPAENGGDAGQAWNETYKNNRIVVAGFNTYKGTGDTEVTKNHILFVFRNCPLRKRMHGVNDLVNVRTSELQAFLEGSNGDGTGAVAGVTTAAFLNAMKQQLGAGHILTIRRLIVERLDAHQDAWYNSTLFLPNEYEVSGSIEVGAAVKPERNPVPNHYPLYQGSPVYQIKRYNGSRYWWWLTDVVSSGVFALFHYLGYTHCAAVGSVGGVSPAFCAV